MKGWTLLGMAFVVVAGTVLIGCGTWALVLFVSGSTSGAGELSLVSAFLFFFCGGLVWLGEAS